MERIALWEHDIPCCRPDFGQEAPSCELYPVPSPRGMVVVLPGGGYTHLADHEGKPMAEKVNRFGWSAMVLRYRRHPYEAPVPQLDARRAVRLARYNAAAWGYRPDRILIMGFSAGAHLAGCTAFLEDGWAGDPDAPDPADRLSARPDGVILGYGVLTMGRFTHEGSRNCLLGARANDPAVLAAYSLENRVTDNAPPAFLWHTAEDGAVRVENSLQLAAALRAHNIPFELHVFPRGAHGVGLAESIPGTRRWPELMREWMDGLTL